MRRRGDGQSLARWGAGVSVVVLVAWVCLWVGSSFRRVVVPVGSGVTGNRFLAIGGGEVAGVVQRASGASAAGVVVDTSDLGTLTVRQVQRDAGGRVMTSEASAVLNAGGVGPTPGRLGFGRVTMRPRIMMNVSGTTLMLAISVDGWAVPCWAVGLVPMISGLYFGRRVWEVRRRRVEGRCLACGYDLRASGERCPECGAVVTAVGGASS